VEFQVIRHDPTMLASKEDIKGLTGHCPCPLLQGRFCSPFAAFPISTTAANAVHQRVTP
jgi:hypothetical protein